MKTDTTTDSDDQPASNSDVSPWNDGSSTDRVPRTDDHPPGEFEVLDPRSISLARFVNAATFAVISAVALVVGSLLLWFAPPFPWTLIVLLVWLGLVGMIAVNVVWWPRWEHRSWSYRVGENVLELHHGVVWHVAVAIPLSRLQHIDLHRGPLERKWGLAAVQIHTAGTRDASHRIPGLDFAVASALRDQLILAANRGSNERSHI